MSLEALEKRVRALEDLEEIKKLHQHYINLMDDLQYEAVLDLFTEDATSEVRNLGVKRGRSDSIHTWPLSRTSPLMETPPKALGSYTFFSPNRKYNGFRERTSASIERKMGSGKSAN